MSAVRTPEMDAWVEQARSVPIYEAVQKTRTPPNLRKSTEGYCGGCPRCGDDGKNDADRFSINVKDKLWNCRKCGVGGNNSISLLVDLDGCKFLEACEILTGDPPPNGKNADVSHYDEEAARERKEERRVAANVEANKEEDARRAERAKHKTFFDKCLPFKGSLAEYYLRNRRIVPMADQVEDIRFAPAMPYWGFVDDKKETELSNLGEYPAMVAAIRDVTGELIGVHLTYIDPQTHMKLKPPGDLKRNKAKKVRGEQVGGHIRLGPYLPTMAVGEGIETTFSFYQMGIGPDDLGIMCAVNLGNLCGKAEASVPHPKNSKVSIPNGIPLASESREAFVPPPGVAHVIMLQDGDSEPVSTAAKMLTGGRRLRDHIGVEVSICEPGINGDFNDLLMEQK